MSDANSTTDPYEPGRIGSRLLALGLLGAGALIWIGWYASTRAELEQNTALDAARPVAAERLLDDFDRSDGPLASVETNSASMDEEEAALRWQVLGTGLVVVDGHVESNGGDQAALAVTDTGWSDVSLGLVIDEATAGSGLLFRFVDLNNHWSVVAAPEFATWNLVLTVEGEVIKSIPTGLTGTEPGTRVAILAQGPEIQVFMNGIPVARTVDPTFQPATNAGVLASPGAVASFDDFFAVEAAPPGA